MANKLTWEHIKTQYPEQWVTLFDLEFDEEHKLKTASLLAADNDLKYLMQKAKQDKTHKYTFRFTGPIKGFLGFSKWELEDVQTGK